MKKLVKVVGAIIENDINQVLCALRSPSMSMPNLWEFPGGKIEEGESIAEAIEREIFEELDCKVEFVSLFNDNTHEYDNVIVNLICVKCKLIAGIPIAKEHSKLLWIDKKNLLTLTWAPADMPAVITLVNINN